MAPGGGAGRKRKRGPEPPAGQAARQRRASVLARRSVVFGLARREMGMSASADYFASAVRPRPVLTLADAIARNRRLEQSALLGFVDPGPRVVAMGAGLETVECWRLDPIRKALELDFEVTLPALYNDILEAPLCNISVTQTEDGSAMVAGIRREGTDMQISIFAASRACQHVASFRLGLSRRLRHQGRARRARRPSAGESGRPSAAAAAEDPAAQRATFRVSSDPASPATTPAADFVHSWGSSGDSLIDEDMLGFDWSTRDHILVLPLDEHAILVTSFCEVNDLAGKATFPTQVPYCRWRWVSSCAANVHMSNSHPATSVPEARTTGIIILDQVRIDLEALLLRCIALNLGIRLQGCVEEEQEEEQRAQPGHRCSAEAPCRSRRRARRRLRAVARLPVTHSLLDFEYRLLGVSASGARAHVACVARIGPMPSAVGEESLRDVGLLLEVCVKTGEYEVLQSLTAPPVAKLRAALDRLCRLLRVTYPLASRVQRTRPRSVAHERSVMSLAHLASPQAPVAIIHAPASRSFRLDSL